MSMSKILENTTQDAFSETFEEQIKIIIRKGKRMSITDETFIKTFQRTFKVDTETAVRLYEAVKK